MSANGRHSSGSRHTAASVAASRPQQLTSSTHSHCKCELGQCNEVVRVCVCVCVCVCMCVHACMCVYLYVCGL